MGLLPNIGSLILKKKKKKKKNPLSFRMKENPSNFCELDILGLVVSLLCL